MSDTFIRKDIIYLYKKLAKIYTTKEQIIFLEQERINSRRLFGCLEEKRISFFNYNFKGAKIMKSNKCLELHNISIFISRFIKRRQYFCHNIFRICSPLFKCEFINYFLYRKYHNYFKVLYNDYNNLIENELAMSREKLALGFQAADTEKYCDFVRKIGKIKINQSKTYVKKEIENIIDLKKEEFILYTGEGNISEKYKILFFNADTLSEELDKTKDENERTILLLSIQKDIKKLLLGFSEINKTMLTRMKLKRPKLFSGNNEILFYIEFLIDRHNRKCDHRLKLTVEILFEQIKRKMRELEKLTTIVLNEIEFLNKKKIFVETLAEPFKTSETEVSLSNQGAKKELLQPGQLPIVGSNVENQLNKSGNYKTLRITISQEKKHWSGTKSEFAVYVNEEYEDKRSNYKSLRETTKILYERYEFDFEWNLEDCYGLVRKT